MKDRLLLAEEWPFHRAAQDKAPTVWAIGCRQFSVESQNGKWFWSHPVWLPQFINDAQRGKISRGHAINHPQGQSHPMSQSSPCQPFQTGCAASTTICDPGPETHSLIFWDEANYTLTNKKWQTLKHSLPGSCPLWNLMTSSQLPGEMSISLPMYPQWSLFS